MVCSPRDESDIERILAHAEENNIAVIPFGGGTSVCGAMQPAVGNSYRATISLDLEHFNRVLEIHQTSRAARMQAGILGPDLEVSLRPHGLTLRHFPQSFKFSTLGGWIATHAGGHFASLYTHVDDFVESTRMITPRGIIQTRRLPGRVRVPRRILWYWDQRVYLGWSPRHGSNCSRCRDGEHRPVYITRILVKGQMLCGKFRKPVYTLVTAAFWTRLKRTAAGWMVGGVRYW